ncbi:MAG: (d)CMP kinase [Desulfobacterales bacterium]|nr:(d)CMP kinase [Desulfobacterales bacterium]
MEKLVIAIDGPAGAGKSTTAKEIALRLGYKYIDTGAMYRAITFLALKENISMDSSKDLTKLAEEAEINFSPLTQDENIVYLNKRDVTEEIRTTEVNENVSFVAKVPGVRAALVKKQRLLAEIGSVIMDGRDIGTVVLPDADLKIYLTASLETRAQRRLDEMKDHGVDVDYRQIKNNLFNRDKIDSHREVAPLKKADDAIEIDTTGMTAEQVIKKIIKLAREV